MISQLTIFLSNEKGRLLAASRIISKAKINMHALFLADTEDFGIARMLTDTPHAAAQALKDAGYRVSVTPVLGVRISSVSGGLVSLFEFLDAQNVNIEYGYCFSVDSGAAIDVLKVDGDSEIEKKLSAAGFELVQPEDVYELD